MTAAAAPGAVMSIDVEDWFQVENLKAAIPRSSWDDRPLRVAANTRRILDVFARTGTRATFFCLGWVAEREPALVREIVAAGHEVASHGYGHHLIYDISREEFREDVTRAKAILEDIGGTAVIGYRAPSFSITGDAIGILAETGHRYDSSYFAFGGHDRYGSLDLAGATERRGSAPAAVRLENGLWELPISVLTVGGTVLPWGGGGYFRLYPPRLFRAGFRRAMKQGRGGTFYLHPWEVDPGQPRVPGIKASYRLRHYVNLKKTERRLEALCRALPFGRADTVLGL